MAIYPNIQTLLVDVGKNATRQLIAAPAAGEAIVVHAIHCTTDANGTALFRDSTVINLSGEINLNVTSRQSIDMPLAIDPPLYTCSAMTSLLVTLSLNSDLDGILLYSLQAG